MAKIHSARNDLAGKLNHLHRTNHSAATLRRVLFLAAGILLFLFLLFNHDLVMTLRYGLQTFLSDASDWTSNYDLGFSFFENLWGRSLFPVLLDMAVFIFLTFFKILVFVALWLAALLLPSIVRIGVYVLPLALAAVSAAGLPGLQRASGRNDEEDILRAGLEGETKALALLKSLGDDCHIFTNLRIPFDGGESETDMIVVTPAGITIVEVKNHKGILTGDASDAQLLQRKPRRNGTFEEKTLHNPIRQVGTHVYRLAGWLRRHGISAYVCPCVFFVNGELRLRLTDRQDVCSRKCPVFTAGDVPALHSYLCGSGSPMSATDYRRAIRLLDDLASASLSGKTGTNKGV